jgi:NarL family two-component system response regulator LiaR
MDLEDSRKTQSPSRIVVADNHPLFRSAISQTLEPQSDLEVVAEAADGREALELCRRLGPDLVLMDLGMPVTDGVAATRAIKEHSPETLVLVLTALGESEKLHDSLEAGAAGYILKDAPVPRIIDAVRRTLEGENPLDETVAMRLIASLMNGKARRGTQGSTEKNSRPPLPGDRSGRSGHRNSPTPSRPERSRYFSWCRKDRPTSI